MIIEAIQSVFEGFTVLGMSRMGRVNIQEDSENFGRRLAKIRKEKSLTQTELGTAIGVSQRVITYYERETERPPAHLLAKICQALGLTMEELLGLEEVPKPEKDSKNRKLLKKLQLVENLPTADQKTLVRVLDGLLAKNGQ